MRKKAKIITALGLMGVFFMGMGMSQADAKKKAETPAASQVQQASAASASQTVNSYVYTSKQYGYTINCPQKPHVIPASALYEGKQGEVLIFANEGYNIKNAWIVIKDAFAEDKIPNLNTINEEEAKKYLNDLMASNGYEGIMLINRTAQDKAVYAITAKEVEIDTDGDGKPDTTATADTQMAVTFFRGNKGGRYSVQLIDNPDLRSTALDVFQKGVVSFKEI
ncbi:hypothetical protein SAMN05216582_1062 [Selenomonas ruminantium]|uniref:Uncharacterized protein n=1 Tax=Selenomonas ruminantium TaxID=971 RepID=A0A1M6T0L9_SELRU|nr:hypothetical protein [Selenomonas ruminantium]SHK50501.1 hypothetical protein SAMN05216582_1062 [Selenomonas ruminantium]